MNRKSEGFRPLQVYRRWSAPESQARAAAFLEEMRNRRTVRDFSAEPVERQLIETCLRVAGTGPSGANLQPWHFSVVGCPAIKRQIREAAEQEEREFYDRRAPEDWLEALQPLGTDANKPFLEVAPWLIAIFTKTRDRHPGGSEGKTWYPVESTGIATGLLIAALHRAGLVTLTHTPSPMKFLNRILDRPDTERPFLLLVTGYPAEDAMVPVLGKKRLDEFVTFHEAATRPLS